MSAGDGAPAPDPRRAPRAGSRPPAPRLAYVAVPACLSALLLLVFFPLILGLDSADYRAATGRGTGPYLGRWLAISAAFFLISALLYALRRARERPAPASGGRSGERPPDEPKQPN